MCRRVCWPQRWCCKTYDGVSDEEATRRAAFDLQWKVALGIELVERPFAKSTLQEFRAQLILHEQIRAIFQRSLEVAKHRGKWKKGHAPDERQHMKLALDTTNILGRGAVKDTYNLLADGIVQVLPTLAKLGPFELWDAECTKPPMRRKSPRARAPKDRRPNTNANSRR